MTIVLDANAGIEISLVREKSAMLSQFIEKSAKVITSQLYKAETTNVISKYVKGGYLNKDEALEKLSFCDGLIDEFFDISDHKEEALIESIRLNHSAYDFLYLVLARRNGARLITLDKKLRELCVKCGIETVNEDHA
jgi:predicted nucleic acid-binding protein